MSDAMHNHMVNKRLTIAIQFYVTKHKDKNFLIFYFVLRFPFFKIAVCNGSLTIMLPLFCQP
jgi:hypothetical protein